jgi:hypothetical protein
MHSQVSFFQPPLYSGGGSPFVADFNGDGKPDILTSDGTMNLGNGDGTFTLGTRVSTGGVLAVADFNGNGKPDLLEQGTGTLLVLLGKGDGTFQAPISTASGASLSAVAATDLNGDGKADVVGIFNSSLMVYISNGDGTFKAPTSYNMGVQNATVLSLGDFNGDGKTDVVASIGGDNVAGYEVAFLGNGDGTFQATPRTSAGVYYPNNAAVGDFNGDGKLDLALGSNAVCNGTCTIPASVYVLPGNGDGTFGAATAAFPGNAPLAAADLNGDGKLDLVLFSSMDPATCQIFLGNGNGTFSNTANYGGAIGAGGGGLALADFNGDGKLDIAAGGVLLGNGDGTFQGIQLGATPSAPTYAAIGDFDKNGTIDVAALSDHFASSLYILSNSGAGKLTSTHTYALQEPGYGIVTADFNGDGNLDLLVVHSVPQVWGYSVLLGNGDGSFQTPVFYPQSTQTPVSSYSIVVADFNNDHKMDVAIMPQGTQGESLKVLLGNGDGTFASPVSYYDAGFAPVVVADFNGDGKLDIAAGGSTGSAIETAMLFGNGNGTFQAAVFPPSLSGFQPEFTADLNHDGKADLVSRGGVALGNGDGTFTVLPPIAGIGSLSAIADFNGDGELDLLSTLGALHPEETAVLLGNADGSFGPPINIIFPYGVIASDRVLIADMNGDGRPDIVLPWEDWGAYPRCVQCVGAPPGMAVLLNTTPPGFELAVSVPSPTPVIAGNSATSTVTVTPMFGFNTPVALSCAGLPSGASCAFNPPSIANSSGTSALTITTSASLAAGTYAVQVKGTSGSIVNSIAMSLVVQAPPDFTIGAASGSPTSQTISAGQTASFSLALAGTGSFTGTVNLSCAITPTVTPPPSCSLSSSSVQLSGTGMQTVTAKFGTTAPVTSSIAPTIGFPPGGMPVVWVVILLGSSSMLIRNRKRSPLLAAPVIVLALLTFVSCGGSSSHTTLGTPAGTYNMTVGATSGSLSHSTSLTVVVQ